jgi:hypothetical protein
MEGDPTRYRDFELPPPPGVTTWSAPATSSNHRMAEAVTDVPGME